MRDNMIELKNGTLEFREKTSSLKDDVREKIGDATENLFGGDFDVMSFVSDKNTVVESVQFVMKTPGIA